MIEKKNNETNIPAYRAQAFGTSCSMKDLGM